MLAVVVSADGTPETLTEAGSPVATFAYPESAARALGIAAGRAEWLRRPAGSVPALDGVDRAAARAASSTRRSQRPTTSGSIRPRRETLLSAYGVPLVPEQRRGRRRRGRRGRARARPARRPEDGRRRRAQDRERRRRPEPRDRRRDVRAAAERIGGPLLVQPMIRGGTELLAGIVQDPVFGPLVAFGPGGVLAELIGGAAFRIAPLTDLDADELVHGGKAGQLVRGFRGAAAADAAALVIARPSALAARGRPARGRGARPQPGPRPARRLRRGRRADSPARAPRGTAR